MSPRLTTLRPASLRNANEAAGGFRTRMRSSLALGISALGAAPMVALTGEAVTQLETIKVEDTAIDPNPDAQTGVPYKARTSGDERHTRPIAETPQSISVLTKAQIDDSGYTDLKEILEAQPGITAGTGENGNAFGDRYIIRGQEARSDVFVDGLRDPGMTTRESFAIEQLEISRGPNSSFAGRGSAGGAVNAITKQATTALDFAKLTVGIGSDSHLRSSIDANHAFGEVFAIRGNAVYSNEEVPDRGPAQRLRKGLALSGLYSPTESVSLVVDYYGLRARDMPDLGGYLLGTAPDRHPAQDVPVYSQTADFMRSDVDTLTARLTWNFTPELTLVSRTRYGTSDNSYATTGASAAATRYSGATGVALPAGTASLDGGHTGWQDVDYFAHQSNLRWNKALFGLRNELIFSVEFTDHDVTSAGGNGATGFAFTNTAPFNCRTTQGIGANNGYCFAPAGQLLDGVLVNPTTIAGRVYGARRAKQQDWSVRTISGALMDTVDLAPRLTAFAGVRLDRYDLTLKRFDQTSDATTGDYTSGDTLVNGHVGLSYEVSDAGMVYASFASAQDINGGEPDSGTNGGYGGLVLYNGSAAGADPETSVNLELGTKWNLFDEQLLLTAAVFQTKKSDVMEGANYDTIGTFNSGKNRVRGVELDVVGKLTDKLTLQAGYTSMKGTVLASATPANVGRSLANFARNQASAQLKYDFTEAFSLGVAGKYKSRRFGGQPDTAANVGANGAYSQPVPMYVVYDVFASYDFTRDFEARLNIGNVTDKDYYLAVYRSGSFLYKGDARNVRLTFSYSL
ncbi:MAG: TonB-dependent receptor [Steroidobacteraceae bacterium]